MYYRHDLDYEYPERSDEHMIEVDHKKSINFDRDYPYFPKGFKYGCIRTLYWVITRTVVFPIMNLSHGLRIHGKKNLRKHKKEYKNGLITISNHVFYWDYLAVIKAMRPHLAYFPAWKENFEGSNGNLIRMSGGIPVPTNDIHAMLEFNKAIEHVLESGKWLHFYPEGSMWFFYPDIRPLKKAVFSYAVKYDKPVLPITLSFRKRCGLLKLFGKGPCVDLHIGEPLYADKTIPPHDAEKKMHAEAYHIMQVMNGINPGDPTYNIDQSIDHYKSTM